MFESSWVHNRRSESKTATTTNQRANSLTDNADSVDQARAHIRRWERDTRLVADDPAFSIRQKCRARRRSGAAAVTCSGRESASRTT